VRLCGIAILIGAAASVAAVLLVRLIAFVTNLAFFHRFSFLETSPAQNGMGLWVVLVPVVGGLIVGFMARYGSQAIRGHGIPEAMEQVLVNDSRIPARLTFLKPVSAAISIGTGGPFGAEGPIIATGGALGSLFGQLTHITPAERKTLLAAGAAAGMIMTEKIARRGIRTPAEYVADPLEQVVVGDIATKPVVTLTSTQTVDSARRWLATGRGIKDFRSSIRRAFWSGCSHGVISWTKRSPGSARFTRFSPVRPSSCTTTARPGKPPHTW
jgi:hypothetical protein